MNITLLGSGGGMPMPGRFLSSMLINYKSRKILIDCGEGTQVSMRKMNSGFKSLDVICLTHYHGDHIFGLPGLLSTIGNSERTEPITIIGPRGIDEIIKGIMVALPYLPYELNVLERPDQDTRLDTSPKGLIVTQNSTKNSSKAAIILSTLELDHSSPCLGYSFYIPRNPKFYPEKAAQKKIPIEYWSRLQNGEAIEDGNRTYEPSMVLGTKRRGIKLSYITDTRPVDTIPDFINESDLFVCEGTYGDNGDFEKAIKNKHMTFTEAAELASRGNVKELWLTHFSPAMDEPELYLSNATSIFPNTVLGQDGLKKTVNYHNNKI